MELSELKSTLRNAVRESIKANTVATDRVLDNYEDLVEDIAASFPITSIFEDAFDGQQKLNRKYIISASTLVWDVFQRQLNRRFSND